MSIFIKITRIHQAIVNIQQPYQQFYENSLGEDKVKDIFIEFSHLISFFKTQKTFKYLYIYTENVLCQYRRLCSYVEIAVLGLQLINSIATNNTTKQKMSERKIWKVEEDEILKELYQIRKIKKWSQISRIMEKTHGVEGRNGKQCRERYHNHLKGGIKKQKWTKQEEVLLVQLHAEHGNRWALISKLIEGRTQNCVKNMLYSKLRKSIRQLNRFSYQYYRKSLKQIKIGFIYRLIEFTQNSYKKAQNQRTQQQLIALRIKNDILKLDYSDDAELSTEEKENIKRLIEDIHIFKRVNQRFRSGQGKTNKKKCKKIIKVEEPSESLSDQGQSMQDQSGQSQDNQVVQSLKKTGEDSSIKTKDENKTIAMRKTEQSLLNNQDPTSDNIQNLREATGKLKPKVSILKMDSLESNLSMFLVDACLQQPIQTQHQFINLTPTPKHPGYVEDWNLCSNTWRNNFTFE